MRKGRGRPVEKSLGLVEVRGLSCAIEVADAMVKAANVVLDELEAARGNGMMTVKVRGDVGAVRAAIEAGKVTASSYGALVSAHVIARPHEMTGTCFVHHESQKQGPDHNAVCPEGKETEETEKPEPAASQPVPPHKKARRTRRLRTAGKAKQSVTPAAEGPAPDTTGSETPSGHSSEET